MLGLFIPALFLLISSLPAQAHLCTSQLRFQLPSTGTLFDDIALRKNSRGYYELKDHGNILKFIHWLSQENPAKASAVLEVRGLEIVYFYLPNVNTHVGISARYRNQYQIVHEFMNYPENYGRYVFSETSPQKLFKRAFYPTLFQARQMVKSIAGIKSLQALVAFPEGDNNLEWAFYELIGLRFGLDHKGEFGWIERIDLSENETILKRRTILLLHELNKKGRQIQFKEGESVMSIFEKAK